MTDTKAEVTGESAEASRARLEALVRAGDVDGVLAWVEERSLERLLEHIFAVAGPRVLLVMGAAPKPRAVFVPGNAARLPDGKPEGLRATIEQALLRQAKGG
jgi:hypothetical protein